MLPYIGRRLLSAVITLVIVMTITFLMLHMTSGDPARAAAGPDADEATVAEARERLGLNKPLYAQYFLWAGNVLQGDFGRSFVQGRDVMDIIMDRLPVTASLILLSLVFAIVISVPLGIIAATRRGRLTDRFAVVASSLGIAIPDFFLGLLLVLGLAVSIPMFPATGYVEFTADPVGWYQHLVLPAITLGTGVAAELTRHIRASLGDVLELDYIRTATAKGVGRRSVVFKHGFRNASMPVVTVMGVQISRLLGSTVVVETVFNLNGLGSQIIKSILERDIPVVLGIGIFSAFVVLIVNLLVDLSYGWLSPKVRT
ncbi:ABC transporter permease [Cumulibacter soli]|uniref:ABC transporter permease n=1 Tax=Cumulibacter soli TaxID=2546344 RepID=UPI001068017E|nr:ABC transporter permease [Cumulibacter soli]